MATPDIPLVKYHSPCFQFARFRAIRERYGDAQVFAQRRFRQQRAAWIAAAFLLGYGELTEQFWWLTIAPESPADVVAISPRKEAHGWASDRLDLAIAEYAHHAPVAGVAGAIARQLGDKAYPADHRLVCYLHHHRSERLDAAEVTRQVRALRPRIAEIWLVGGVESDDADDYLLARLHPELLELRLNTLQHCAETPQLEVLDAGRVRVRRPHTASWRAICRESFGWNAATTRSAPAVAAPRSRPRTIGKYKGCCGRRTCVAGWNVLAGKRCASTAHPSSGEQNTTVGARSATWTLPATRSIAPTSTTTMRRSSRWGAHRCPR